MEMEVYIPLNKLDQSAGALRPTEVLVSLTGIERVFGCVHQLDDDFTIMSRHPVVRMWENNLPFLVNYGFHLLEATKNWAESHRNPLGAQTPKKIEDRLAWHLECATSDEYTLEPPEWFGRKDVHRGYRGLLLRNSPLWYSRVFDLSDMNAPLPYLVSDPLGE